MQDVHFALFSLFSQRSSNTKNDGSNVAIHSNLVFCMNIRNTWMVLYEAMVDGLPIIAADSHGTCEVLENGHAGFIFNSHDTF